MTQLIIPFRERRISPRCVEWIRQANAGDYSDKKYIFYPLKSRLCRRFGLADGYDLQTIVLKCWCGDGIFRGSEYTLPERFWKVCNRCCGTGIYLTKHIPLIRWQVGDTLFHEPSTLVSHHSGMQYTHHFYGLIKHPAINSQAARRAMERLLLRYEPERFINLWHSRWKNWEDWNFKVRAQHMIRRVNESLRAAAWIKPVDDVPF